MKAAGRGSKGRAAQAKSGVGARAAAERTSAAEAKGTARQAKVADPENGKRTAIAPSTEPPAGREPTAAPAGETSVARDLAAVPLAQLQALAEPKRLWIVDRLRDGEHCVCDLTAALDAGQSLLSHHLRVLREAGLVTDRREGRWSYYSLVPETLAFVERWLAGVRADTVEATDTRCQC